MWWWFNQKKGDIKKHETMRQAWHYDVCVMLICMGRDQQMIIRVDLSEVHVDNGSYTDLYMQSYAMKRSRRHSSTEA